MKNNPEAKNLRESNGYINMRVREENKSENDIF